MNPMLLIYVPVAALFVAFVVYAGLVTPAMEITDSLRNRHDEAPPDRPAEERSPYASQS